jgi:hypothetical protein
MLSLQKPKTELHPKKNATKEWHNKTTGQSARTWSDYEQQPPDFGGGVLNNSFFGACACFGSRLAVQPAHIHPHNTSSTSQSTRGNTSAHQSPQTARQRWCGLSQTFRCRTGRSPSRNPALPVVPTHNWGAENSHEKPARAGTRTSRVTVRR